MPDSLTPIITAILNIIGSLIVGLIGFALVDARAIRRRRWEAEFGTSYQDQISQLSNRLRSISDEAARIMAEMSIIMEERAFSVSSPETELENLSKKETELRDKLEALENVPIEAVDHFTALVEARERRSALRDYILFALGVLVSTVGAVAIALIRT